MSFHLGRTTTRRSFFSGLPTRAAQLSFLTLITAFLNPPDFPSAADPPSQQRLDSSSQLFYANAHPYLEEPFDHLVTQIPELQGLHPASDQQALPAILSNTGRATQAYFNNLVDLVAHEDINQEKLNAKGAVKQKQHLQYNYLILLHRDELPPRLEEYRTDPQGNGAEQAGLRAGFSVTSGFALICIHFLPDLRSESTFKYLGDQMLDSRNTYVVAFAQRPAQATATNNVSGGWGSVPILVQGIAWIDQDNSQIIRIRTDLLASRTDIGLSRQSTQVIFSELRLPDSASSLWLPRQVNVSSEYKGQTFHNEHQYSGYQRFRVSVRMVPQ
jgi:hypothetical protein